MTPQMFRTRKTSEQRDRAGINVSQRAQATTEPPKIRWNMTARRPPRCPRRRSRQPDAIEDPLTEVAREGARRILAQVLIAEADAFVALWKDLKLPDGRDRIVRHGHGPQRSIQTGVGPVEVRRAKVRDRGDVGTKEKIRFKQPVVPVGGASESSECGGPGRGL
jgi:hypothetical protein